jgi:CubicO group peptidase (beta-lactamase class C family)
LEVAGFTKEKVKFFSGGGGLLSTASDYARFCQMLLNGGEMNGVRLLSPKTLAVMTSDQIPPGALHCIQALQKEIDDILPRRADAVVSTPEFDEFMQRLQSISPVAKPRPDTAPKLIRHEQIVND